MITYLYSLITLLFLCVDLSYGGVNIFSEEGVTPNLREMIQSRRLYPKRTDNFITHFTRSFVLNPTQDMSFFSDPLQLHETWNNKSQEFFGQKKDLSDFLIFSLMGISRRALLLNGGKAYKSISDAQALGMLKMLQGGLGEGLDESQKAIIARELANIGRSLTRTELMHSLREFETLYERSASVWERRHFQVYALQMIAGHNRDLINPDEWYLKGTLYRDALLNRINEAADKFLPKFPVAHGGAGGEAGGVDEDVEMPYSSASAAASAGLSIQDYLKILVSKAIKGEWGDDIKRLITDLSFADRSLLTNDERNLIDAISHLNAYHHTGAASAAYDEGIDQNTLNKAVRKLQSRPVAAVKTSEEMLEAYLNSSQIINYFDDVYDVSKKEKLRETFKNALLNRIQENGGKFPSLQELNTAEQFFWNIFCADSDLSAEDLLESLFKTRCRGTWQNFAEFYKVYDVDEEEDIDFKGNLKSLLPVYQAFPDLTERQAFIDFCGPYLEGLHPRGKIDAINSLLPIYQAFSDPTERQAFINFCGPHLEGLNVDDKIRRISTLLPVYHAFPDPIQRQAFIDFYTPYLEGVSRRQNDTIAALLSVYQVLPDPVKRGHFVQFARRFLEGVTPDKRASVISSLLPVYQAFPSLEELKLFIDFTRVFLGGVTLDERARVISSLLPVYQAFPNPTERGGFVQFAKVFLAGVTPDRKANVISSLLPVYQAFPSLEELKLFIDFTRVFFGGVTPYERANLVSSLLPVYRAFPGLAERGCFIEAIQPFLTRVNPSEKANFISSFLPVYQAFPGLEERRPYIYFCYEYFGKDIFVTHLREDINTLLPIYQKLTTPEERKAFMDFCKSYHEYLNVFNEDFDEDEAPSLNEELVSLTELFSIYQSFAEPTARQNFKDFCVPYLNNEMDADDLIDTLKALLPNYKKGPEGFKAFIRAINKMDVSRFRERDGRIAVLKSYANRSYLRFLRVNAALTAELNPSVGRSEYMCETKFFDQLPTYYEADPFAQQAMAIRGANAHDFDTVYEMDRPILFEQSEAHGYKEIAATTPHTLYNNRETRPGYTTNAEVEDLLQYLETTIAPDTLTINGREMEGAEVVSLIKQMLGLEQKTGGTTGGFAPYLGNSMYYAKPEAPKGDEMLGRAWFYMKAIAKDEAERWLNKKSVILSMLEAAELSSSGANTHCQTRMTGELMKLIAFNLPGSKLRPLIAAVDLPPLIAEDEAAMRARITTAPDRAKQLFNRLKVEDSGAIRTLIERHTIAGTEPELWERYQAYYDELYRRTRNEDGTYKKDEHVLMRDAHGNLASLYDVTGEFRAEPVIVYYQSEFQVYEQTFTELMQKQFEERRVEIY